MADGDTIFALSTVSEVMPDAMGALTTDVMARL